MALFGNQVHCCQKDSKSHCNKMLGINIVQIICMHNYNERPGRQFKEQRGLHTSIIYTSLTSTVFCNVYI